MRLQKIPFRSTNAFTEFFLKYIEHHPSLQAFYGQFPSVDNFAKQIAEKSKSFPATTRNLVVRSLKQQYKSITSPAPAVEENIDSLLDENTFTVTTGHQLSIFTGPLYFIYKIVTVINACRLLKKKYPKHHFVPVYWMASEDHDYEEIKSFRLYGKQYTWETSQQGAVGRFHTREFKQLIEQLPGDISIFKEAYLKGSSLSEATRIYVNGLFSQEGLVVIDADDKELKKVLQPVIQNDLFDHSPFKAVTESNKQLEALGLHPQVNPREINFFYLDKNLRARLERMGDDFVVVDTDLRFTKSEIQKQIKEEPEKFSPNVILRPLYQEMILPNLAYVGGPAELVYWLELQSTFKQFDVPFPILLPRNFALIVEAPIDRKLSKTKLQPSDFFKEKDDLFKQWVVKNAAHDLSLQEISKSLVKILADLEMKSTRIDKSLTAMAAGQASKVKKIIETIEKKMIRAEKRQHSDKLRQIEAVKDALFPNGSLQERTDNFLNFYQQDPSFIQELLKHLDPFDFQFNLLSYDEKGASEPIS